MYGQYMATMAECFHCAWHAFNLSWSCEVSTIDIRRAEDVIRDLPCFCSSAKRNEHLLTILKAWAKQYTRAHLANLCTTRFVERHTAVITV